MRFYTCYIAVPEGSADLFKWAHTHKTSMGGAVILLTLQPLNPSLFIGTSTCTAADAQTRGSRVSCLYPLTGFFFASMVYKKVEEKPIEKTERQEQTQKVTCTTIQHIECSMNQKCP